MQPFKSGKNDFTGIVTAKDLVIDGKNTQDTSKSQFHGNSKQGILWT